MKCLARLIVLASVVVFACGQMALGTTYFVSSVDQLRNTMNNNASPGDTIRVMPGSYNSRLWVSGVHGLPGNMINIIAHDPANRPVFSSDAPACFTLNDCSYIMVDGIIAEHGGTPTQDANNIEFPNSNHMIIKNSVSRDMDHDGNSDAYKFAQSNNILMYNCVAENWADGGAGVDGMVSNSSLFMRNTITFPTLPDYAGAIGIMPKGGAYHHGMYKNHFIDGSSRAICFGGSGGAVGPEIYDSVAMGNLIEAGEAAVAYVSSEECEFSYNTVINPEKYVMRILKEGAVGASDCTFKRNIIEYGNVTVQNIGSGNDPASFTYQENYWYKWTNPGGSIPTLASPEIDPAGGVDPQLDSDGRPHYAGAKDYGRYAPQMESEFEQYAPWFQWAWDEAQAFEPKAEAGGLYRVGPGGAVRFDGSASYAGVGSYGAHSIGNYLWDIDWDSDFDDGVGQTVDLTYANLAGMGLGSGEHTVELAISVANEYNTIWDWGFAELDIVDLRGDADGDGLVDGLDYVAWSNSYPLSDVDWIGGDFNGDRLADGLDYVIWSNNYSVPGAPVPEPGVCMLLAVGALLGGVRRRRAAR